MNQLAPDVEKALRQLRAHRTEVSSRFNQLILSEGPISCHKNCNHCCYYPLYITLLEGITIYRGLSEGRLWSHALRTRFKVTEEKTWRLSLEVWLLSTIACPLLGDNGLCQGYACRPTVCRTVYSRGDPNLCHPHRFLQASFVRRREVMEQWYKLEQGLMKPSPISLPLATAVLLGEFVCKGEVDLQDCNPFSLPGLRKW